MKKTIYNLSLIFCLIFTKNLFAQGTIVDVAISNKNFSTLVTALKSADLVGALQGKGPFTVFAPTNDETAPKAFIFGKIKIVKIIKIIFLKYFMTKFFLKIFIFYNS